MNLPEWLDPEAWSEYIKMRVKIKKPMTDYAKKLALKKLSSMQRSGHDTTEVLNQSIFHCWQGLYEPRDEENTAEVWR